MMATVKKSKTRSQNSVHRIELWGRPFFTTLMMWDLGQVPTTRQMCTWSLVWGPTGVCRDKYMAPRLKSVPPKDLPVSVDSTQDQPYSYKEQSGLALSQSLLGAV